MGLSQRQRASRSRGAAALAWVTALTLGALFLAAPLAALLDLATPLHLADYELEALGRSLSRGLSLSVIVASVATALAALLARTLRPWALLALLLISRSATALGVLELGLAPGKVAAVVALIIDILPFAALLIGLRLRTLPRELVDAAADLGARPIEGLARVTLPHLGPVLLAAWLWALLQSLGDVVAYELAGGGHSYTPGLFIRDALLREQAASRAAVAVLAIVVLALPCAALIARELHTRDRSDWRPLPPPPPSLRAAGLAVLAVALAAPGALLLGPQPSGLSPTELPLAHASVRSFALAGLVGLGCSALGFALALLESRLPRPRAMIAVILAPLAIPPGILGMLALVAATRTGVDALGPGLALTTLTLAGPALALAFVAARSMLAALPPSLRDCARDLGAQGLERLRLVWLPLGRPALAVAFAVVFAWVLGQAALPSFTSGPGDDTLAVSLTVLARAGELERVRRWSLVLVALPLLVFGLGVLVGRARSARATRAGSAGTLPLWRSR